jgi:hypothetical protein
MVYPHLVVADRFNHQSALFAAWNDRVYSHYDIPRVTVRRRLNQAAAASFGGRRIAPSRLPLVLRARLRTGRNATIKTRSTQGSIHEQKTFENALFLETAGRVGRLSELGPPAMICTAESA